MPEPFDRPEERLAGQTRLELIIAANPVVVYCCDALDPSRGMILTFVSDNIQAILGYTADDCIGRENWWRERVHPEDRVAAETGRSELFGRGRLVLDYRFQTRKGDYLWIRDQSVLARDKGCQIGEIIGSWTDVSDLKASEKKQSKSAEKQARLNQLLSLSLKDLALREKLGLALDVVLGVSWYKTLDRGAILLTDPKDPGMLRLAVHRNMDEKVLARCNTVPFGHCHCGLAAETGQIRFNREEGEAAEIGRDRPHGHFNVPIMADRKCLGVMVLYQDEAATDPEENMDFLEAVGQALVQIVLYHRTSEQLKENEAQLRAVLDTAAEGVIVADIEGRIHTFNRAAENILGFTAREIIGQNVSVFQPEPHRSNHGDYIKRYLETGVPQVIGFGREVEGVRKDGSLVPLFLSVSEARVGQKLYFTGLLRDITEYKAAQEYIGRSRASLARAQAIAHLGNWDLDLSTDQLSWSDEVYRICGLIKGQETLTYKGFLEAVHPDDRFLVVEAINAALYDNEDYDLEHRIVRPDGSTRIVHEKGDVIRNEMDDPVRMVGTVQDITERKKAEEEIVRARKSAEIYAQELRQTLEISETMRQALEDEIKVAAELQKSLLPTRKQPAPEVFISWEFMPCEALGGDMINVFKPDPHHLAAYIFDVSGHGVPSALLTFAISQSLSLQGGIVREVDPSNPDKPGQAAEPARILTRLDMEYMVERFNKSFTIIYLLLDLKTGLLRYANAGHPPALLLRTDGGLEKLETGGPLIGLGGILPFEQGETRLDSGDRILLYTDGVTEYPDQTGVFFGQERLETLFGKSRDQPLEQSTGLLIQALENFGDWMPPPDDATLLALEFRRSGET